MKNKKTKLQSAYKTKKKQNTFSEKPVNKLLRKEDEIVSQRAKGRRRPRSFLFATPYEVTTDVKHNLAVATFR